jgi:DnaK suppressor protein
MPSKKPSAKAKAKKTVSAKPAAKKPAGKPAPKAAKPAKAAAKVVKPIKKGIKKAAPVVAPVAKVAKPAPQSSQAAAKPAATAASAVRPAPPITAQVPKMPSPPRVVAIAEIKKKPAVVDTDDDGDGSANLLAGPRNVTPYQVKRGEQYMNKEQLDHFRNILATWKHDLMEEVDRTVLHMKDEAANFPDPNDRATQESEFSLELRTRDRERKLIRKIDEAISRIDDGSYGYCVETGEEIGIKRLEARPVATLCVEAQERRERREKQYGDRDDRYR